MWWRTRSRSSARSLLAVALGLALVLGTDAFLLYGSHVAHPVSAREAVSRFRSSPGPAVAGGPRAGVYLYDTEGYSRVSAFGVRRAYPRVSARIVRGHGCGWREEVPLFAEHVETYDHCGGEQTGFGTRLSYFLVPSESSYACAAAACRGPGVTATLTVSAGGDDARLGCRRVTLTTVLRGDVTGGAVRRLCVAPSGLVVREERSVGVRVRSAFVGDVDYVERATFALRSAEPLT